MAGDIGLRRREKQALRTYAREWVARIDVIPHLCRIYKRMKPDFKIVRQSRGLRYFRHIFSSRNSPGPASIHSNSLSSENTKRLPIRNPLRLFPETVADA